MLEEWTLHRPQVPPDIQGAHVVLDWAVGKQGFPFQSFFQNSFQDILSFPRWCRSYLSSAVVARQGSNSKQIDAWSGLVV